MVVCKQHFRDANRGSSQESRQSLTIFSGVRTSLECNAFNENELRFANRHRAHAYHEAVGRPQSSRSFKYVATSSGASNIRTTIALRSVSILKSIVGYRLNGYLFVLCHFDSGVQRPSFTLNGRPVIRRTGFLMPSKSLCMRIRL